MNVSTASRPALIPGPRWRHGSRGGRPLVASGALAAPPGRVASRRPTTNLVVNPRFADALSGWFPEDGRGDLSLAAAATPVGDAFAVLDANGDPFAGALTLHNASVGVTYSARALVSAPVPLADAGVRLWNATDGGLEVTGLAVDSEWRWIFVEGHEVTAAEQMRLTVYPSFGGTSGVIHVAAVQLEASPTASAYLDGDLGEGYSWSVTAHASASSREATRIRAGWCEVDTVQGSLGVTVWPDWPGSVDEEHVVLEASRGEASLRLWHEAGEWRFRLQRGGVASTVAVASTHAREAPVFLAARWTGRGVELSVDGVTAAAERAGGFASGVMLVEVGRSADDASGWLDGLLGTVRFASGRVSDETLAAWRYAA